MKIKVCLAAVVTTGAVAAAVPAAASAGASSPPSCYGQTIVAPAAQAGIVGPFVSGVATSTPPGTIAAGVAAFKASCGG